MVDDLDCLLYRDYIAQSRQRQLVSILCEKHKEELNHVIKSFC